MIKSDESPIFKLNCPSKMRQLCPSMYETQLALGSFLDFLKRIHIRVRQKSEDNHNELV